MKSLGFSTRLVVLECLSLPVARNEENSAYRI